MSGSSQGDRPPLMQRDLVALTAYPPPRFVWADDTREAALAAAVAQVEFEEAHQAWQQLEYFIVPEEKRQLRRRFAASELHVQERPLRAKLAAAKQRRADAQALFGDATRLHEELAQRDRLAQQAAEQAAEREREDAERQAAEEKAARHRSRLTSLLERVRSNGSPR